MAASKVFPGTDQKNLSAPQIFAVHQARKTAGKFFAPAVLPGQGFRDVLPDVFDAWGGAL